MSSITTDGLATLDGKIDASLKKLLPTAWASINGTEGATVINDSHNFVNVVEIELGRYSIEFATPMDTANYSVGVTAKREGNDEGLVCSVADLTTAGIGMIRTETYGGTRSASDILSVVVFGGLN